MPEKAAFSLHEPLREQDEMEMNRESCRKTGSQKKKSLEELWKVKKQRKGVREQSKSKHRGRDCSTSFS